MRKRVKVFSLLTFSLVLLLLIAFPKVYGTSKNLTSIPSGFHYCGDGFCDRWENCKSCPEDCGSCEVSVSNETTQPFKAEISGFAILSPRGGVIWSSLVIGVLTILAIIVLLIFRWKAKY